MMYGQRGTRACMRILGSQIAKMRLIRLYRIDQKILDAENTTADYYEGLLVKSHYDERGYLQSSSGELLKMLDMSSSIEDFEVCLKALYNFMGSRIQVANSIFDRYINRAIEIGCPEKCLDLVDYHQFLNYYPHTETLKNLFEAIRKSGDGANCERIYTIVRNRKLLKLDSKANDTLKGVFELIPDEKLRKSSAKYFSN